MAKIDVSKIEGYENMTPEQKIAALEGYDTPDPDYSGYVKKDVFDKTASELAEKKKQLQAKMTEDEAAKQKEQEEREKLQKDYEALLHKTTVSENKAKLLAMGYEEKLAPKLPKLWRTAIPKRFLPTSRSTSKPTARRFVRKPLKIPRSLPPMGTGKPRRSRPFGL